MTGLGMKMMTAVAVAMAVLLVAEVPNMVYGQPVCGVDRCQAWALFVVPPNDTLYLIANRFSLDNFTVLQNLNDISDPDNILPGQLLRIPFSCNCVGSGTTLFHAFSYSVVSGDQDDTVAMMKFSNLTTAGAIDSTNGGAESILPGMVLQVPINCSCGDPTVSEDYGMFGTYSAQPNDSLSSLSRQFNISEELLRKYNPAVSFDPLQPFISILFIPMKNSSGQYPSLVTSPASSVGGGGPSKWILISAMVGSGVFLMMLGLGFWLLWVKYKRKSQRLPIKDKISHQPKVAVVPIPTVPPAMTDISNKTIHGALPGVHCVHFSYEELVVATENFSLSRQIGKGGFATVFYGEWQGQKLAVKQMDMKATQEFLNEIRILSSVHHANLVDLIGYCTEKYLVLVYEYVDNGTLAHHLRSGKNPLQWITRVQIALDAARGVEYMHDHTRPTYIHRDLKPSNILLDSNFHAKVGDFGLTRLVDPDGEGWTRTIQACGTLGYMAPEYAQFGTISVKLDVYSFGVILYQLVSGREALAGQLSGQLLPQFEEVLKRSDGQESVISLVDPALGTEYSFESVWKMVKLAYRCTQRDPDLRPPMRDIVMELMTLSDFGDGVTSELTQGFSVI
ncbi:hypothetical protein GOP47_0003990 [Adiantum capillus-veneris]|uniref:Uncharacterized protein n=1 Tax=Adiantum capillus-veneris TaxID=13818 RepID=A0A9D4V7B0_ADICA|nr:hypothetical protein GOP47_0003990 [Adiantum capillus-veneris]